MIVCFVVIGILCIAVATILLYYNKAFPEALRIADEMQNIGDDYYFFGKSNVGFIIFTGAKTDERAYTYIAKLLHEKGHTVIIPKQKFHLSAFGTKHGMELMSANPKIEKWILVGHSLGGVPVSRIAAARPEHLTGAAFLATYEIFNHMDFEYDFKNLYRFKSKFDPSVWKPRYLVYDRRITLVRLATTITNTKGAADPALYRKYKKFFITSALKVGQNGNS
ncbi:MAG: hypothetical protein LUE29_13655 [Lachnospiraceae bacterium]|nr:hypothetical protein [Lachnospiraceae bacterium]